MALTGKIQSMCQIDYHVCTANFAAIHFVLREFGEKLMGPVRLPASARGGVVQLTSKWLLLLYNNHQHETVSTFQDINFIP